MKRKILIILSLFLLATTFFVKPGYSASDKKLEVFLFFSPHCGACIKLKKEFLPHIIDKYKDTVEIVYLDTTDENNLAAFMSIFEKYEQKKAMTPAVAIGNDLIAGRQEIEEKLEILIDKYLKHQTLFSIPLATKDIRKFFEGITIPTLIWAGLLDGINPCAFAVIVFLISFLGVYGYNKKEMLIIGIFYTLSVFITYVLIGIGIFKFLYSLERFYVAMKVFYYSVSGFCFILFCFALFDYLKFKKTKETSGLLLQLPNFLKKKINLVIGAQLRGKKNVRYLELCCIAMLVGMVVSLLEAACTGQVYLPTIALVLKSQQLQVRAFSYLLLYNLMFIMPLIVVFAVVLCGVTSKQLNNLLKNNLGLVKILMALLFLTFSLVVFFLA